MLQQLNWMPLAYCFVYRTLILAFKVLHDLTPNYLDFFKYVNEINTRLTRLSQSNALYIPRAKTEYFRRFFTVYGALLWTNLSLF